MKGYLCKALVTPTSESGDTYWQAWSKSLDRIEPGIGRSMQQAIDALKENLRSFLIAYIGGRENVNLPWTVIVGVRGFGSKEVLVLVDGVPGPDGKMPEQEAKDAPVQS